MSNIKARVDPERVLDFISGYFREVNDLNFIQGGELSQAFSFTFGDKAYVIRVSKERRHFDKDKLAVERFSSEEVPIPAIVDIGRFDDKLFYAISYKIPGETIETEEEVKKVLPSLIKVLDNIHKVDISGYEGYGPWKKEDGDCKNWREHLLSAAKEESFKWPRLLKESFLEREFYDRLCSKLEEVAAPSPGRWLVHGDIGMNNTLAKDGEITAVIDWAGSLYGDFLFDVAWLDFWMPEIGYKGIFETHYESENRKVPNFEERILACKLYISLTALGFFARTEQKDKYDSIKKRVIPLLE